MKRIMRSDGWCHQAKDKVTRNKEIQKGFYHITSQMISLEASTIFCSLKSVEHPDVRPIHTKYNDLIFQFRMMFRPEHPADIFHQLTS
uniref:Uncharacterized protein n=1 Tax=Romanomermis culicivorax TaxID=13658 RepID=A0A915HXS8_ROMCU